MRSSAAPTRAGILTTPQANARWRRKCLLTTSRTNPRPGPTGQGTLAGPLLFLWRWNRRNLGLWCRNFPRHHRHQWRWFGVRRGQENRNRATESACQ